MKVEYPNIQVKLFQRDYGGQATKKANQELTEMSKKPLLLKEDLIHKMFI